MTGGSGADTFNASVSATAAENTLNNADVMDGGAGSDTAVVIGTVLAANIGVPAIGMSNIETVNLRAVDGDGTVGVHAMTFNASLATGVTSVNADRGNSNVTVTGLAAGAEVGMIGNGVVLNGILSYAYATATSAQVINISGGTLNAGTVSNITATASTGVTTATINSTGAANKVDTILLDSAAGNTVTSLTVNADTDLTATLTAADFAATAALTITGAGAASLGTAFDGKTIDASANTGGVTIALNANTTSATFGSGNDVITSAAIGTTAAIDAGAGTDTLVIGANTAHVDTAAEAGRYSGFETLSMSGTLDVSLVSGINALALSGASTITNASAAMAGSVQASADIGNTAIALQSSTGTSDVLNLQMGTGLLATEATDITGLTANGFETINISLNPGPTATAANKETDIASFTADKVTAINLVGGGYVDIANAATTLAVTIDGTGLTGNGAATSLGLDVAGNLVAGSTVRGSGVVDTFDVGTVGSTYQGNAGNDNFQATAVTQLENGAVWNTLDGGAGTDTVKVTAAAVTLADSNFAKMSNMEKLTVDADGGGGDISVTTGGFFDANFTNATVTLLGADTDVITYSGATYTGNATIALTSTGLGNAAAEDITVTTGAGADTVTVTCASWVGAAGASSGITIATGAGADTITMTHGNLLATTGGTQSITAGTGADTITKVGTNDTTATALTTFVIADGDSTVAARDKITGFDAGDGTDRSDILDLSTGTAQGNTAGTDGTDSGTINRTQLLPELSHLTM